MGDLSVAIAGAGPAGLMLAYQLVTHGISTRVIERYADLARELPGEYLQSSVFAALEQLGILPELMRRKLAIPGVERRMFVGLTKQMELPGGGEPGMVLRQEGFLQLLHDACSKYPHHQMDFRTTALDFAKEGDRVAGLKVSREGVESIVNAHLVVVCNGRNSGLRKACGMPSQARASPADTIWMCFDFSDAPQLLPQTFDVHLHRKGVVAVFHATTRDRLQYAYSAPRDLNTLPMHIWELKKTVLPFVPEKLRAAVDRKLDQNTKIQVLRVTVDRLKKWHAPGVLFLGDAAHTMSSSGGQGLSAAIGDAIVAANHLLRASKPIDDSVLAAIQAERLPEIEMLQAGR